MNERELEFTGCQPHNKYCHGEIIPCSNCDQLFCEYHEPREGHLRSCFK